MINVSQLWVCGLISSSLTHMAANQVEVKPKSEVDKLKEKYPALCKPDAPVWRVRLISYGSHRVITETAADYTLCGAAGVTSCPPRQVPPQQPGEEDEQVAAAAMKELEMLMPNFCGTSSADK